MTPVQVMINTGFTVKCPRPASPTSSEALSEASSEALSEGTVQARECTPCADQEEEEEKKEATCEAPRHECLADTWHTVLKSRQGRVQVLGSRVNADGGVWGGCYNTCKNQVVDMERFAPTAATCSNGARQRFVAVLANLRTALRAEDWDAVATLRADVKRLRTNECDACRKRLKLSPKQRKCLKEWDRMRQEACLRNNGCANKGCPERGMEAWIAITADHGKNPKRHDLSSYKYWASHGGVDAMREEAKQIHQWICACCHALERTSNSGRVNDPATMKPTPNEAEHRFRERKWSAAITFPKYEYVNERKRAIGKCQYAGCAREVKEGNEASFDFDHRDEGTKRKCRCLNAEGQVKGGCHGCDDALFGRRGGVCGLANNHAKAAALEYDAEDEPVGRVKALLDDEMDEEKCDLLCHNCHICRKPLGLARNEVYERPAPPPPRALSMTKNAIWMRARAAKRKREADEDEADEDEEVDEDGEADEEADEEVGEEAVHAVWTGLCEPSVRGPLSAGEAMERFHAFLESS